VCRSFATKSYHLRRRGQPMDLVRSGLARGRKQCIVSVVRFPVERNWPGPGRRSRAAAPGRKNRLQRWKQRHSVCSNAAKQQ
jgi:hypothetical protein